MYVILSILYCICFLVRPRAPHMRRRIGTDFEKSSFFRGGEPADRGAFQEDERSRARALARSTRDVGEGHGVAFKTLTGLA